MVDIFRALENLPDMTIVKDIRQMFDMGDLFDKPDFIQNFRICQMPEIQADFNALARRIASYVPYADNHVPLAERRGQSHIDGESLLMTPQLWWDRLRPLGMSGAEKNAFDILRRHIKTAESLVDAFCLVSLVYSRSPYDTSIEEDILPTTLDSSFVCCYNRNLVLEKGEGEDRFHLEAGKSILHVGDYGSSDVRVNAPEKEPDGTPLILLSALLG